MGRVFEILEIDCSQFWNNSLHAEKVEWVVFFSVPQELVYPKKTSERLVLKNFDFVMDITSCCMYPFLLIISVPEASP